MLLVIPNAALLPILRRLVQNGSVDAITYHLFTNDVTPDESTVLAGLTEAAWTGYAAVPQDIGDFTFEYITGGVGTIIAGPFAFGNGSGSPQLAYGYYITMNSGADLLAAARFDLAPVTVPDPGGYTILPILSDIWSH